jgi:DNA-binding response OmpR family regulator
METFDLLLAHADRTTSNIVESVVRKFCADRAILHSTHASRIDELSDAVVEQKFDLVIVGVDNLWLGEEFSRVNASTTDVMAALKQLKSVSAVPVIALSVTTRDELSYLNAGADYTMSRLNCSELKSAIERFSRLPSRQISAPAFNLELGNLWKRASNRFNSVLRSEKPAITITDP